jgi:mRNA-degrading endonuclease RelE of RelBE toxin-antitoxin system
LPAAERDRIRAGLEQLARATATTGRISGKKVKTIRGQVDSFHRLRVGDYRVMYDSISEDRVLLVLGIVHRWDLERWLRSR